MKKLKIENKKWKFLDIALPELKIDIEYDGKIYHMFSKERDKQRDQIIKSLGWKIIRINQDNKDDFLLNLSEDTVSIMEWI